MPTLPSLDAIPHARLVALCASLMGLPFVLAWRVRETTRPITARRIVIPPLGMATGFAMFALPAARVPWSWGVAAFLVGAMVFAIPLARTSRLERRGGAIHLRRSRAFLAILIGLVVVRLLLRGVVEALVTPIQTGALFFVLAFGTIARWRFGMLRDYRRLVAEGSREPPPPPPSASPPPTAVP